MTRDTDEQKLLPCPFCGGAATIEEISSVAGVRFSVGCDSADEIACMGYQNFTTFARRGEAKVAWNTRAHPSGHAEREALLRMERACEQLAATRSMAIYTAMIDGGQADALLELDNARKEARAALSNAPAPSEGVRAEITKWRDDALEKAALIVLQCGADPAIASYIRALKSADTEDQGPDTLGERNS